MIYLDNQSTTQIDPRVLDTMMPFLTSEFGNSASRTHELGRRAATAVTRARQQVAGLLDALEDEIVFTSGATEAINLALKGVVEANAARGNHVVTSTVEHKAVLDTCGHLARQRETFMRVKKRDEQDIDFSSDTVGAQVSYVSVQADGTILPSAIEAAMTPGTVVVAVMLANNEIGTIQPVRRIAEIVHAQGSLLFSDVAQAVGKLPVSVKDLQLDLASVSAHKLYGPKGVGALYVRSKPRLAIAPLIDGGGHERGLRSGTLNVAGIVGFGAACELAKKEMASECDRIIALRERLRMSLWQRLDNLTINGSLANRLPGNLNVSFVGVDAEALMMGLKDIAVSAGSACTSASLEPSYVLRACGVDDETALSSIRFSVGRFNTQAEIDRVADAVVQRVGVLRRLRERS